MINVNNKTGYQLSEDLGVQWEFEGNNKFIDFVVDTDAKVKHRVPVYILRDMLAKFDQLNEVA